MDRPRHEDHRARHQPGQPRPRPRLPQRRPLVYLKDINYDQRGRPVLLYLTSAGHDAGPDFSPRTVHTARWTGDHWDIRTVTDTDHNDDHGSLYIEPALVSSVPEPASAAVLFGGATLAGLRRPRP